MITAALLVLALQSSAEDCAVLEAAIDAPFDLAFDIALPNSEWPPDQVFVGIRPARIPTPGHCFDPERVHPLDEFDFHAYQTCQNDVIDRFERQTPEERLADGHQAGMDLYVWLASNGPQQWQSADGQTVIPDGIAQSLTDAVNGHQSWGCRSGRWQYFESDYYDGAALHHLPVLTEGESGYLLDLTRPGYSDDGRWAVAYYRAAFVARSPIPNSIGFPIQAGASDGYLIFERRNGQWVRTDVVAITTSWREIAQAPGADPE
jgi:hypothetical protein